MFFEEDEFQEGEAFSMLSSGNVYNPYYLLQLLLEPLETNNDIVDDLSLPNTPSRDKRELPRTV